MTRNYNLSSVEKLLSKCSNECYDFVSLDEGSLGYGHLILIAPDDKHWSFEIKEYYINPWSSEHTVRRFKKISKALQKEIDKAYEQMIEEETM